MRVNGCPPGKLMLGVIDERHMTGPPAIWGYRMNEQELNALKDRLESVETLDEALAGQVVAMLADEFKGAIGADEALAGLMQSAESAVQVVGHVHAGWALSLKGHASARDNAKWHCTLKESRGADDDQIVGIGNANTMRLALLAAVTHIRIMRAAGYV